MLQRLPGQYLVHIVKVETPAQSWIQRLEVHLNEALAHSPIPANAKEHQKVEGGEEV
eukprot:CAMPEP_0179409942 /NCGR_PEP_ID=MMETSP0799-20121207/2996_1 /TAXON_ID=46947 /ORGANISM="Geminigera cryophila, Strain CCMP2564" /LENGTH=56 /DNA_ID=CAMNT_0021181705 /DNA_START=594 /DNA_END=764 /DNA_ORIENTATION=-